MKQFILAVFILGLAVTPSAQKQNGLNTGNSLASSLVTFACEGTNCAGLTVDATAGGVSLTSAKYNPTVTDQPSGFSQAQRADCTNSGAKIWITATPSVTLSSGKGQPVLDGGQFTIYGYTNISQTKLIRDAAVSSTVFCDYSRQP